MVGHPLRNPSQPNPWAQLQPLAIPNPIPRPGDIEACLTNPNCNTLAVALDWMCLNLERENIPIEVPPPNVGQTP